MGKERILCPKCRSKIILIARGMTSVDIEINESIPDEDGDVVAPVMHTGHTLISFVSARCAECGELETVLADGESTAVKDLVRGSGGALMIGNMSLSAEGIVFHWDDPARALAEHIALEKKLRQPADSQNQNGPSHTRKHGRGE